MSKSTHFFGQPVYGQLIKTLDHDKIVLLSAKHSNPHPNSCISMSWDEGCYV